MVKYNDSLLSPRLVTSRVIQESVLGSFFFLMYINDIRKIIKFERPYLYSNNPKWCQVLIRSVTSITYQFGEESGNYHLTITSVESWNLGNVHMNYYFS